MSGKQMKTNWTVNLFTGLSDGLIIPFALIAGYSRLTSSTTEIAGLIIIIAPIAALLMAMGGYFTARDQAYEQKSSLGERTADIKEFYANIGFTPELQQRASEEHLQEKLQWEQIASTPQPLQNPLATALTIFFSYCIGALLSLSPYFFCENPIAALKISAAIILPLLFISGYVKSRITNANPWLGGGQLLLFGLLAGGAAFGIAHLFR
jgi:vacuolar iron transporter family protein